MKPCKKKTNNHDIINIKMTQTNLPAGIAPLHQLGRPPEEPPQLRRHTRHRLEKCDQTREASGVTATVTGTRKGMMACDPRLGIGGSGPWLWLDSLVNHKGHEEAASRTQGVCPRIIGVLQHLSHTPRPHPIAPTFPDPQTRPTPGLHVLLGLGGDTQTRGQVLRGT